MMLGPDHQIDTTENKKDMKDDASLGDVRATGPVIIVITNDLIS